MAEPFNLDQGSEVGGPQRQCFLAKCCPCFFPRSDLEYPLIDGGLPRGASTLSTDSGPWGSSSFSSGMTPVRLPATQYVSPGPLEVGQFWEKDDFVEVYSQGQKRWYKDGIVENAIREVGLVGNLKVKPGMIFVSYSDGKMSKWLAPDQMESLRPAAYHWVDFPKDMRLPERCVLATRIIQKEEDVFVGRPRDGSGHCCVKLQEEVGPRKIAGLFTFTAPKDSILPIQLPGAPTIGGVSLLNPLGIPNVLGIPGLDPSAKLILDGQVLVLNKGYFARWVPCKVEDELPEGAVDAAPEDKTGQQTSFVARSMRQEVGKVQVSKAGSKLVIEAIKCRPQSGGRAQSEDQCEVLVVEQADGGELEVEIREADGIVDAEVKGVTDLFKAVEGGVKETLKGNVGAVSMKIETELKYANDAGPGIRGGIAEAINGAARIKENFTLKWPVEEVHEGLRPVEKVTLQLRVYRSRSAALVGEGTLEMTRSELIKGAEKHVWINLSRGDKGTGRIQVQGRLRGKGSVPYCSATQETVDSVKKKIQAWGNNVDMHTTLQSVLLALTNKTMPANSSTMVVVFEGPQGAADGLVERSVDGMALTTMIRAVAPRMNEDDYNTKLFQSVMAAAALKGKAPEAQRGRSWAWDKWPAADVEKLRQALIGQQLSPQDKVVLDKELKRLPTLARGGAWILSDKGTVLKAGGEVVSDEPELRVEFLEGELEVEEYHDWAVRVASWTVQSRDRRSGTFVRGSDGSVSLLLADGSSTYARFIGMCIPINPGPEAAPVFRAERRSSLSTQRRDSSAAIGAARRGSMMARPSTIAES